MAVHRRGLGRMVQHANGFQKRQLFLEALECRRLLAGDGIEGDAVVPLGEDDPMTFRSGTATGTKWHDVNGNGIREANEPGLAGITIYADENNNRRHDPAERWTKTQRDHPRTKVDESGRYVLDFLSPGPQIIREIVPDGFQQTFPIRTTTVDPVEDEFASVTPDFLDIGVQEGDLHQAVVRITIHPLCIRAFELDVIVVGDPGVQVINHDGVQINGCGGDVSEFNIDILAENSELESFEIGFVDILGDSVLATIPVFINGRGLGGGHVVNVEPGQTIDGLDFGNRRIQPQSGNIEGRKWLDRNGDGQQDADEPGLGGVDVYVDLNENGRPDRHEPRTRTRYENPDTDFEEGGLYSFELRPGDYVIREVVPRGFRQTFPQRDATVESSETGRFATGVALDLELTGAQSRKPADDSITEIEFSVLWPDGCGQLLADRTSHTVIGDSILVEMHGHQTGFVCTEALKTDTLTVAIPNLEPGAYDVIGTLHEPSGEAGREIATLGVVGEINLGPDGSHRVTVEAGSVISGLNFGNRQTEPGGSIHGLKWHDLNGDGRRQRGEPGLGGVTIYSDLNLNGQLDFNEPKTVTRRDDPNTLANEAGTYAMKLTPGEHLILEVVPRGFEQTYPSTARRIMFPYNLGHGISVESGRTTRNVDFGNHRGSLATGLISGITWLDSNANGVIDRGEQQVPGRVIYLDDNDNGRLDDHERRTVAGEPDIDVVLAEGSSDYFFRVRPGDYIVRQVVPSGFSQTYPFATFVFGEITPFDLPHGKAISFDLIDAALSSTSPTDDGQNRMQLTFESVWPTGGVEISEFEASLGDDGVINVDIFAVTAPIATTVITPLKTTVTIGLPEIGRYRIQATLHEAQLEAISEPMPELVFTPSYELQGEVELLSDGAHRVSIGPAEEKSGLHFGSFPVPVANNETTGNDEQPVSNRPGDTNEDGIVNFSDFLVLSQNFGKKVDHAFADADFSKDGFVNFDDFLILAENFGVQPTS